MATHIRIENGGDPAAAMSTADGFRVVDSSMPLKLLEQAIAACIGRKLLSLASEHPVKLLGGLTVSICGETVKIRSAASEEVSEAVEEAIRACYVLERVMLEKELIFTSGYRDPVQW